MKILETLLSLVPVAPDPAFRQPLTLSAVAPVFACYYAQAFLVQLPRTFYLKLALLPVIISCAWHAATGYDLALRATLLAGKGDPERLQCWNYAFVIAMIFIPLRAIEWTFASKPYRRLRPSKLEEASSGGSQGAIPGIRRLLQDTAELSFNQRGYSWSWSHNPFPYTSPRSIARLILTLFLKVVVLDAAQYSVQYLRPSVDQPGGDTIFDPSLSPAIRITSAVYMTLMAGIIVYTAVDALYLAAAIPACLFFGHATSEWPPLSNRPWLSTSVADFWGNRWHRFFRRIFITIGSRPFLPILGTPGAVMGAFTLSAVIHDWGMYGLGRGTEFSTVGLFFVMMGVGVLLEGVWENWLKMGRVHGWKGWTWTMIWTVGWGTLLTDGWARKGMVASDFLPGQWRAGKWLMESLIRFIEKYPPTRSANRI